MPNLTLGELFKGQEAVLSRIMESYGKGIRAKSIATIYVKPVLEDLQRNAGQELDPLYVAYMCEAVHHQITKP